MRSLVAKPEPIDFYPSRTALVVVDMQNGYCSPGGYFSHLGVDLAPRQQVIPTIAELVRVTRDAGMQVVWLQNGWDRELKKLAVPVRSINSRVTR